MDIIKKIVVYAVLAVQLLYETVKFTFSKILKCIRTIIYYNVRLGKFIYRTVLHVLNLIYYYIKSTIKFSLLCVIACYASWKMYEYRVEELKNSIPSAPAPEPLQTIFNNVAKVTDVSNRVPPLYMSKSKESPITVNAFTTGNGVYFTQGAYLFLSDNEKALVIGHEIAHVILHHTDNEYYMFVDAASNENELMADNLGAVWAHKAGYDVCKGREVFKQFYEWDGNSLNASHPPNLFRYDNLAHWCYK